MKIGFHKDFKKQYRKLNRKEQRKIEKRLDLFVKNKFNSTLNNHALRGKFLGYSSINITGDLRAIYKKIKKEEYLFVDIGSHSKLYS